MLEENDLGRTKHNQRQENRRGDVCQDDPESLVEFREKVASQEQERDAMKRFNAAWRKAKKPTERDSPAMARFLELADVEANSAIAGPLVDLASGERYQWEKSLFPSTALANLGASIRRHKRRLEGDAD